MRRSQVHRQSRQARFWLFCTFYLECVSLFRNPTHTHTPSCPSLSCILCPPAQSYDPLRAYSELLSTIENDQTECIVLPLSLSLACTHPSLSPLLIMGVAVFNVVCVCVVCVLH